MVYVDATVGGGGHSLALLKALAADNAGGRVLIGLDQDPEALSHAGEVLAGYSDRVTLVQRNFTHLGAVLGELGVERISGGVLADLGVSSYQLDEGSRGFSFRKTAPLDMRMDPGGTLTAADIVNEYPETELSRIFSEYGEERFSKTVAREIVERRKAAAFTDTTQLADLVASVHYRILKGKREARIHPATQVFQALRIAVNDEIGVLERFLESLPPLLAPGARVVVISFHSLEDRVVKRFFQRESRACVCPPGLPICQCGHVASLKVLTTKPVSATEEEMGKNPRSRSAKLRAAERI